MCIRDSIAAYNIDQLEANLADMDDASIRAAKGIGEMCIRDRALFLHCL